MTRIRLPFTLADAGRATRSPRRIGPWRRHRRRRTTPARRPRREPRSKSPVAEVSRHVVGRLEDRPGDAGPVVEVEPALALVGLEVGGEEDHRPAEQRELVDDARVVGDEDVADEQQLVDVGVVRDVDREAGELRVDRRALPDERVASDQDDVIAHRGPRAARAGRGRRRTGAARTLSPRNVGAYRITRRPAGIA